MLEDGGRLAIVLPEIAFHGTRAPTPRLRDYITEKGRVVAIIDLPHNTFRPYCNAKTCLLVVEKGRPCLPTDSVLMAEASEMGHDRTGRELYRPGTDEVWDDLPDIATELDDPGSPDNRLVQMIPWRELVEAGHWVPRYYTRPHSPQAPEGRHWVQLGDLVDEGIVDERSGHGSPASEHKGAGSIPYFRTSDIVQWELYRNPVSGVTRETFEEMTYGKPLLEEQDIVFVRRGSYRLGTVAMASARDSESIVMRELHVLRVNTPNRYGITPFYLLGLLSSESVQQQLPRITFLDTTFPNLGNRWRELMLPLHCDSGEMDAFGQSIEDAIRQKWLAQDVIEKLRKQIGGTIVT